MFKVIEGKVQFIDDVIIVEKETPRWLLYGKLQPDILISCPGGCGLEVILKEYDQFSCKLYHIKVEEGFIYTRQWKMNV